MKKLILILAVVGIAGCGPRYRIYKDVLGPEHSMGVVVVPVPTPEPMPMPFPNPYPEPVDEDPFCCLPGVARG